MVELCSKYRVYKSFCECWGKTAKKHAFCEHENRFILELHGKKEYEDHIDDGVECRE